MLDKIRIFFCSEANNNNTNNNNNNDNDKATHSKSGVHGNKILIIHD